MSAAAALLAILFSAAVQGRVWEGRGEFEIRVRSSERGAVSGAQIELLFLDVQPPTGPPTETTGPRGRAKISGLAEGTWSIRIRHPDHLTYGARLEIEIGRKVDEIQAFHESEGEGTGILRVDFRKVRRGPPPPPRPSPAPTPSGTSTEPLPATRPAPEATEPPEESRRQEERSTTEEEPPPGEAEPPGEPSPEPPETEAEVRDTPADLVPGRGPGEDDLSAEPEPPGEETPTEADEPLPEAEPPEAASGDREPALDPPTTPVPEAATGPEPSPPPRSRARLRSASRGTCPDCRGGETALSVDAVAPPGGPGAACPGDSRSRIEAAVRDLAGAAGSGLGSFYGPLVDPTVLDLLSLTPSEERAAIRSELGALFSDESPCRALVVVLPSGADFTGFRYEARGVEGSGDCLPGQECPIGQARWIGNPVRIEAGGHTVVSALFVNRSPTRERHPRFTVYFSR